MKRALVLPEARSVVLKCLELRTTMVALVRRSDGFPVLACAQCTWSNPAVPVAQTRFGR